MRKFFEELSRHLREGGVESSNVEDRRLEIFLHGQPVLFVSPGNDVFLFPAGSNNPEASELYHRVAQTADEVYTYVEAVQTAPTLHISGLSEKFHLLADFGGAVLAGRELENGRGYQFVTWIWDYNRTGVSYGHYLAALYLLASKERLWQPALSALSHDSIDFSRIVSKPHGFAIQDYLKSPEDYIKTTAEQYMRDNQEEFLAQFLRKDALLAEYQMLSQDSDAPVYRMRAITDALQKSGAKTVNVTVQKDGMELTFKTSAESLKGLKSQYSTWYIAPSDRLQFRHLFGAGSDYSAEDIIRIAYGRSTLYEAPSAPAEDRSGRAEERTAPLFRPGLPGKRQYGSESV